MQDGNQEDEPDGAIKSSQDETEWFISHVRAQHVRAKEGQLTKIIILKKETNKYEVILQSIGVKVKKQVGLK